MLVFLATGQLALPPYINAQGGQEPPNIEAVWPTDQLTAAGFQILAVALQPSFNPATQSCTQDTAPTLINGQWTLGWTVAALTQAQQLAYAAQQAQAGAASALASGLAITSTATPALSATYAVDPSAQANINAEITSFLLNGVFTNQQATYLWPDLSGAPHAFTVAQFKTFATAVAAYVNAVVLTEETLAAGGAATWPVATATIP